jgi:hypothetical protein
MVAVCRHTHFVEKLEKFGFLEFAHELLVLGKISELVRNLSSQLNILVESLN